MRNKPAPHKISLFISDLEGGGAERAMITIASGLAQHGLQVDLILQRAGGVLLPEVPEQVRLVDLRTGSIAGTILALWRYLIKNRPAVLYSMLDLANLMALISAKLAGGISKTFVGVQNTVSQQKRSLVKKIAERVLLRIFYPRADGVIAVSRGAAEDIARYARLSSEKLYVISNPVIINSMFQDAQQNIDDKWPAKGNEAVILAVGRLTDQKDFSTLIKSFALVRKELPARLLILGKGEEHDLLRNLANDLGVGKDVHLPGYVPIPFPYMRKCSLFVMSSKWEGLPSVLIQAVALGCKIVSTDCLSGPTEILRHGRYGELVPVGDVEALAAAIKRALRAEKKTLHVDWADDFSADKVVARYLDVFGFEDSGSPG